jgi:hypothetical protein
LIKPAEAPKPLIKPGEGPKPLSIAEKAKMMMGGQAKPTNNNNQNMNNNINNKNNNINNKINANMNKNINMNNNINNNNKNVNNNANKNTNNNANNNINPTNKKPLSKFEQMRLMMENKGIGGKPRPSAQINPGGFNFGKGGEDGNKGIINDQSDKMKAGYNPVNDLEKKLDNIVVQKDKKKKKKPNFQG